MISIFELQRPIKIKRFPNSLASVSRISRPPVKVLGVNTLKPTPSSTVHKLYSKYTRRSVMKMR